MSIEHDIVLEEAHVLLYRVDEDWRDISNLFQHMLFQKRHFQPQYQIVYYLVDFLDPSIR